MLAALGVAVSETNNPQPTDEELWNALRPKTKEAAPPPPKSTRKSTTWRSWFWIGVAVVVVLAFLALAVLIVIAVGLMATA